MPDKHEEVIVLKDLDPTILEATLDGLVEELDTEKQAWACFFLLIMKKAFQIDVSQWHFKMQ